MFLILDPRREICTSRQAIVPVAAVAGVNDKQSALLDTDVQDQSQLHDKAQE